MSFIRFSYCFLVRGAASLVLLNRFCPSAMLYVVACSHHGIHVHDVGILQQSCRVVMLTFVSRNCMYCAVFMGLRSCSCLACQCVSAASIPVKIIACQSAACVQAFHFFLQLSSFNLGLVVGHVCRVFRRAPGCDGRGLPTAVSTSRLSTDVPLSDA